MGQHRSRAASWIVVIIVGLFVTAASAPLAIAQQAPGDRAPCNPRIIDLGTLGGANSEIDGANRLGVWVGAADDAHGVTMPVLWRGGAIQTLGESDGFAADITNAGVVVGNANTNSQSPTAFWWYRGTVQALPVPGWSTGSYVRRINQRDDAVGSLSVSDGSSVPVEWRRLHSVRVLPLPTGATSGEALGINDAGEIVGDVSTDTALIAWEWGRDGSSHALQPEYAEGFSQANLINDRGWAAGGLDFGGQLGLWGAVWRAGSVSKLGQLGADENFSFAFGQDQIGDYVGGATYSLDDPYLHVFVTRAGSGTIRTMLPLSGNLLESSNAHAVVPSYQGQPGVAVGGDSTTSNGDDHATVWTCAFRQAFTPTFAAARIGQRTRVPAWRRSVDGLRP
jgi:uncharacterized membrane protein